VTLINLGDNHHANAEPEAAHHAWCQAHAILHDLGHPDAHQTLSKLRQLVQ
jgi:hypothetical protein